jgi:hypothetical protein
MSSITTHDWSLTYGEPLRRFECPAREIHSAFGWDPITVQLVGTQRGDGSVDNLSVDVTGLHAGALCDSKMIAEIVSALSAAGDVMRSFEEHGYARGRILATQAAADDKTP